MGQSTFALDKFLDAPPDVRLAAVAVRQHGLVTIAQLLRAGLDHAAVSRRVRAGRLHRVARGVYAVGHASLSREARWLAAVLEAGRGAALTGLAAAAHWAMWRRRVESIEVIAPRRSSSPHVHWCRHLDRRDITVHDGIPVTTVARTLVDLTDVLNAEQLANVIHEAAFRQRFSPTATRAAMERANGRRNLHVLQAALEAHAAGSAGTKSGLEDRFLAQVRTAGLQAPLVNVRVAGVEVDFHWPEDHLCVEIDGSGHARPRTRRQDAARDARLRVAGYEVVRVTEEEVISGRLPARIRRGP